MGRNGCDSLQSSRPWAIGSGYRFSGSSGVGRSPTSDRPPFGACGRGPLPTGCGCGECRRGDPSPSPQRALLRAGFARCRAGTRGFGGGASCLGVGRPGSGALSTPTARPWGCAARAHYPLAVGGGGVGVGTRHKPHSARSCKLALRALGAARGCPGGGASCLGVGCPGLGAPPSLTARPLVRAAVAHYPVAVGGGGVGVRTRHQPHSPRCCELAVRAVGAARKCQGGAPLAWVWGVRGRALSHARPFVLWGVRPGPTTHWLWVRGLWTWGPITNPTARAVASWLCALWGPHEGARWGARLPCMWGVGGRALSHPRPIVLWNVRPGPATHWQWVRGLTAWGPVTNPTARALAGWLCAL